jgi:dCTP deaminase
MILSDKSILQEIKNGNLIFEPQIQDKDISPCSVDVHLGDTVFKFKSSHQAIIKSVDLGHTDVATALKELTDPIPISDEGFSLKSHGFVIAFTKEKITLPPHIAARLEGRSTNARFGISIHSTAPTVHPTWSGCLALEICNQGELPCILKKDMAIGQLIFEYVDFMPTRTLDSVWLKKD